MTHFALNWWQHQDIPSVCLRCCLFMFVKNYSAWFNKVKLWFWGGPVHSCTVFILFSSVSRMWGFYPLKEPDAQSPCRTMEGLYIDCVSLSLNSRKCSQRRTRWKPGPVVSAHYMSACRLTSPRKKTAQRPWALPRNAVEPSQSSPKCLRSKYYWSAPIHYILGSRQPWSQTLFKGGARLRCIHRLWNDPPNPRFQGTKDLFYIELALAATNVLY